MDGVGMGSTLPNLADSRMILEADHLTNSQDHSTTSTMNLNLDLASSLTPRPSVIASAFVDNDAIRFYSNGLNEETYGRLNSNLENDLRHEGGKRNCGDLVMADQKKFKDHPSREVAEEEQDRRGRNRKRKSTTWEFNSDPEFDPGRSGESRERMMVGSYLEMRRKNNAAVKKSRFFSENLKFQIKKKKSRLLLEN